MIMRSSIHCLQAQKYSPRGVFIFSRNRGWPMTIKEIARLSGYGVGTVSRVLNNNPNVSDKARRAIMEVVEANNFQPNENARRLRIQTHSGIAIIIKGRQNMLFEEILERMQIAFENADYSCSVYYIDEEDDETAEAARIQKEQKPYGFVMLGSNPEVCNFLSGGDAPVIFVTNSADSMNMPNLSSISTDDYGAAICMINYLFDKGHTRIGIIGGDPQKSKPSLMRLSGCQAAFMRHGQAIDMQKQYAYSRFSFEGGYAATEKLLQNNPDLTAIFAMSDIMAIGAIRALYDHGKRVPADVSVTGFDGIEISRFCNPVLTTIWQNTERMAERGAEILIQCIEEETPAIYETVPFSLQEGGSVRDIREA